MKFFWIMLAMTLISIYYHYVFSKGLEMVMLLIIVDLIALLTYNELYKKDSEKSILKEKLENLERLTSQVFEKINSRFTNNKDDKKELIESLNKF